MKTRFFLVISSSNSDIPGVKTKLKGEKIIAKDSIATQLSPLIDVYLSGIISDCALSLFICEADLKL